MINLKQTLNHGLVLKKLHGVIKFNKKAWLDFFKLLNKAVFGKTMENVRKHRDIAHVLT